MGGGSHCEPFRQIIGEKLHAGLSAQRIHQDLVAEHGFAGKYWSVYRFVSSLPSSGELPFRRIEVEPGEELQVDFGNGAKIRDPGGAFRRTHVFRCVLSHARKGYTEAVFKQDYGKFHWYVGERVLGFRPCAEADRLWQCQVRRQNP